jgi:hypothetical protein
LPPVPSEETEEARAARIALAREYIDRLISRARSESGEAQYEVVFDSGLGLVTWIRSAAELLQVNGSEPLVAWLLRESDLRGHETFSVRRLP